MFNLEEVEDQTFSDEDFTDASKLADYYERCHFINCQFQNADLEKIKEAFNQAHPKA